MKQLNNIIYVKYEEFEQDVDRFLDLSQTNDIYIVDEHYNKLGCLMGYERHQKITGQLSK